MTPKRAQRRVLPDARPPPSWPASGPASAAGPTPSPGSPEWNVRADAVARAMRLIADGVVDREGVAGLAGRLGYSERHLHRLLVAELGAGPLALARAQRAQTARMLDRDDRPCRSPRSRSRPASPASASSTTRCARSSRPRRASCAAHARRSAARVDAGRRMALRLAVPRRPFDGAVRCCASSAPAVPGVEDVDGTTSTAARCCCPTATATVELTPGRRPRRWRRCALAATCATSSAAVARCRRLLDLDADPVAIDDALGADPLLGAAGRARRPGVRVPGSVDGDRDGRAGRPRPAGLGRRRAHRRRPARRGVRRAARRAPDGALTHLFPTADALADVDPETLPMPRAAAAHPGRARGRRRGRRRRLDAGADRDEVEARAARVPGIGPWTADYLRMRALGDPDVVPADRPRRPPRRSNGSAPPGDPRSAADARPSAGARGGRTRSCTSGDVAMRPTTDRKDHRVTDRHHHCRQPGRPAAAHQRRRPR